MNQYRRVLAMGISSLAFLTLVGCGTNSNSPTINTNNTTTASNAMTGTSTNTTATNTTSTRSSNASVNAVNTALANSPSTNPGASGTSSNAITTNSKTNILTSPVGYTPYSKQSLGSMISGMYGIQGTVTQVNQTSSVLQSLTVKVTKPLQLVNGQTPFQIDKVLTIYFQQPLSKAGSLQITTGSNIELTFGQFALHSDNKSVYGSNFSWLSVEKNGAYNNAQGKVVKLISPSGKRG